MLVLRIYGIPDEFPEEKLKSFWKELRKRLTGRPLRANGVIIFFPTDRLKEGLGEEIIIFAERLFLKEEKREDDAKRGFAKCLITTTREYFPNTLVECFIQSYEHLGDFFSNLSFGLP